MDPGENPVPEPATGLLGSLARALQGAAQELLRTDLAAAQRPRVEALAEASGTLAALLGASTAPRVPVRVPPELADVAPGYLMRRRHDARALREAAARGAFAAARRIGHDLKGSGLGYGFPRVSEVGARIENAARRSDAPALLFAAEALAQAVEDAARELRATPHPDG